MKMIKKHYLYKDYGADKNGNAYSLRFNKVKKLKLGVNNKGYLHFGICINYLRINKQIHRFVFECFKGKIKKGYEVCHNDNNKYNNILSNLRQDTSKGNQLDKIKFGTILKGEYSPVSKLKEKDIIYIRKNKDKYLQIELSKKFNVTSSHINRIIHNKEWKHI